MRRSEAQLRVGPGAQSRGGHQRLSFSHAARRGIAEPHLSRSFFRVGEERLRSQGLTSSAGQRGSNFVGRKPPHAHPLHTYMLSLVAGDASAVEGQARGAAKRAGWEATSRRDHERRRQECPLREAREVPVGEEGWGEEGG